LHGVVHMRRGAHWRESDDIACRRIVDWRCVDVRHLLPVTVHKHRANIWRRHTATIQQLLSQSTRRNYSSPMQWLGHRDSSDYAFLLEPYCGFAQAPRRSIQAQHSDSIIYQKIGPARAAAAINSEFYK
jgi:hypothetical protein